MTWMPETPAVCRCLALRSHVCPPERLLHVGGIPWWESPVPRRWHRCKPQTRGWDVERCACGAIRFMGDRFWMERNTRARRKEAM